MSVILLLLLIAAAAAACTLLFLVARARNKRLLLGAMRGLCCDAPDSIGISVLCSGVSDPGQVENLLSVEYARYEVVLVLDARRHPAAFADLVSRYRMIRVEWVPTGELPAEGVRAMGRSRRRCYRRLVLVDRAQGCAAGDFDAGAVVAAYDYLLPVQAEQFLLPGAVERLVAELGELPAGSLDAVRTRVGVPVELVAREAVIAAGGFAGNPVRRIPRARRRTLWEPLLVVPALRRRMPRAVVPVLALLLAAGIALTAFTGRWTLTAVLLTAALVWTAAGCAVQLLTAVPGVTGAGLLSGVVPGKLRVKNFTIS